MENESFGGVEMKAEKAEKKGARRGEAQCERAGARARVGVQPRGPRLEEVSARRAVPRWVAACPRFCEREGEPAGGRFSS